MIRPEFAARVAAALGALILVAGCGSGSPSRNLEAETATPILRLAGLEYGRFVASRRGAPPKDEAEFRKYLDSEMNSLSANGVKSADDLLKSPRDGEPLVIYYGKKVPAQGLPGTFWAAYEKSGVGDKRLASNTRGTVVELTPEFFQDLKNQEAAVK